MGGAGTQGDRNIGRNPMRHARNTFYALVAALNLLGLGWLIGQMMNPNVRVWEWSL